MRADVSFTPEEVDPQELHDCVAVVIDVVRATSTMVEALVNGARGVHPTVSIEDAIKLRSSLGREQSLLCGERKGVAIEGFDLGNSPAEYDAETVGGIRLVMTTTNGTKALSAASGADRVLVSSLLNLKATARVLVDAPAVRIVCAGKEGRFAMDDAVVAGHLLLELAQLAETELVFGEAARAALVLAERFDPDADFFRGTAAGQALVEVGLGDDLDLVARRDLYTLVPELRDRTVHAGPAAS